MKDIASLTAEALTGLLTSSYRAVTTHKAQFLVAIGEFDDRRLARELGSSGTVNWMMRKLSIAKRTAFEYLNVARALRKWPDIELAFLEGRITYSMVRLLLRYVTEENVDELLLLAQQMTIAELQHLLQGRVQNKPKKAKNLFRFIVDPETGASKFFGSLDPQRTAEFRAALKNGELAGLGIVEKDGNSDEAAQEQQQLELRPVTGELEERESPGAAKTRFGGPQHGSLLGSFLNIVSIARCKPIMKRKAPGAEVHVMLTEEHRGFFSGSPGSEPADTVNAMINGYQRGHLLDRNGVSLDMGRKQRTVNATQEKALLAAWGFTCAGPGCNHTHFLEFHHIKPWAKGGETDVNNLIPLCSGCHALVSDGHIGVFVEENDARLIRFRFPDGDSYTSIRRKPPIKNNIFNPFPDNFDIGRGDPLVAEPVGISQVHQDGQFFDDVEDEAGSG